MRNPLFLTITLIAAVLVNLDVRVEYLTTVSGIPVTWDVPTEVIFLNGDQLSIPIGEQRVIDGKQPFIVQRFVENFWIKTPVNPQPSISVSFKKAWLRKPERMMLPFVMCTAVRCRKTKVLLFSPKLRERTYPGRPPIYYLASVLRKAGYPTKTADVDIVGQAEFQRMLREWQPHLVAGTSLSIQINDALELLELAKAELPSAITLLGGNHATAAGEYLYPVHARYLDAVAVGEGLTTIIAVADTIERRAWDSEKGEIAGLLLWDGAQVVRTGNAATEEPDTFTPDLTYHHTSYNFPIFQRPDGRPRKTFQVMTAFGCRNACFFCFSSTNLRGEDQRVERRMSIDHLAEILRMAKRQGYEAVYFDDDTFTRDRDHALALTGLCRELGLVFGCHTRPDCEDEKLIHTFATNGCHYMFAGLESAVPEILLGANKTHDPEAYRTAYLTSYRAKWEAGIPVSAFMIHGMPRRVQTADGFTFEPDTLADSKASIEFAVNELDPTYLSMNVLRFLPGVPYSFAPQFAFLRPVGPLHGGYFDRRWLEANGKKDPRCFHPILRAFEGSGSPIPPHMTPQRCYDVLRVAVQTVNLKNQRPDAQNQTRIVVDPWFARRFLAEHWNNGTLRYHLAPFHQINS